MPSNRPPAEIDPARLADAICAACWSDPGEAYCFTFNAAAVELIVRALREAAMLRNPPS